MKSSSIVPFLAVLIICGTLVYATRNAGAPPAPSPLSEQSAQSEPSRPSEPSIEEKLATIDGAPDDALKIARFKSLLGDLAANYACTRKQAADCTVQIQTELHDKAGIDQPLVPIMEAANTHAVAGATGQDLTGYLAAYYALRKQGLAHTEASTQARAFFLANAR